MKSWTPGYSTSSRLLFHPSCGSIRQTLSITRPPTTTSLRPPSVSSWVLLSLSYLSYQSCFVVNYILIFAPSSILLHKHFVFIFVTLLIHVVNQDLGNQLKKSPRYSTIVKSSSWRHLFQMHQVSHSILMSHSIHIITVFILDYWFHQQLVFIFMYTLCKVTSSTFKFVCALPAELQERSLSKSPKPKCNLARLLNTFLLYVVAVRELFLFVCLHCACFVY